MRGTVPVVAVALVVACRAPAPAPPVTTEVQAQPDCSAAAKEYGVVLGEQAVAMEGADRDAAQARVPVLVSVTQQRCHDDQWSAGITECMAIAASTDAQGACAMRLRADQYRRWFLQLMTSEVPKDRLADEKLGPNCLQIEDHYQQLIAAAGHDPRPATDAAPSSLARAWVARILFERCLVDNWPEPARSCFGSAAAHNTCTELLPELARTALQDHLVDMAESLGVPY